MPGCADAGVCLLPDASAASCRSVALLLDPTHSNLPGLPPELPHSLSFLRIPGGNGGWCRWWRWQDEHGRWRRRGGGDGGEDGEDENAPFMEVLAKAGKDKKDVPSDLLRALEDGSLGSSVLKRLWALEAGALAPLLSVAAVRDRLLADPTFFNKIAIDCLVGGFAQGLAELQVRKDRFFKEADFVVAGILTCVFGNLMAVYLTAPTVVPQQASAASNRLAKFISSCPDNAFQKLMAGQKPFSIMQRVGALVKPMPQLFMVGLGAAAAGYTYTSASIAVRQWLDQRQGKEAAGAAAMGAETIAKISVAVGVYCAVSTNGRYQVVAGLIEARLIDKYLAGRVALQGAASTLVRTGNTYLGSYWIVEFLRMLKLQKVDDAPPAGKRTGK